MAHTHDGEAQAYYLDQLCTIALCGGLAGVGVMMWHHDLLKYILAPQFHLPVLAGSLTLLALVIVRAVVLWRSVDRTAAGHHGHTHANHHEHAHDHEHAHGHEHTHDHDCCGEHTHDHGQDHEHGWNPWRYAVLTLPIALYLLDLPNPGFSQDYLANRLKSHQVENVGIVTVDAPLLASTIGLHAAPGGDGPLLALAVAIVLQERNEVPIPLQFSDLKDAAYVPSKRRELVGKTGKVLGQFVPGASDNTCSLVRIKMTCCPGDATPLNVVVVAPDSLTGVVKPLDWVEIEGQVQFRKRRDKDEFLPVLQIKGRAKIKPAEAPKNPYL